MGPTDALNDSNENYNILEKHLKETMKKMFSSSRKNVRFNKYKHKISPWIIMAFEIYSDTGRIKHIKISSSYA